MCIQNIYPEEITLYWGYYICNYNYKLKRYYSICKVFKLEKLHHYSICNVLYFNLAHYYPWVNNYSEFIIRIIS